MISWEEIGLGIVIGLLAYPLVKRVLRRGLFYLEAMMRGEK